MRRVGDEHEPVRILREQVPPVGGFGGDPDAGGGSTFNGARLSDDGGATPTHYACSTLIDVDYIPPGQGGQTALDVLDAFYATGHYKGYRIQRPDGDRSALLEGEVDVWRSAHLDDQGVPQPAGWYSLGTGRLSDLALTDAGLVQYEDDEEV